MGKELKHSMGGSTTKDGTDAGVDMLPGDPKEREGPEDAFGQGLKRGDYRGRVVTDTPSYTFERGPDGIVRKVLQNPLAGQIGDVPGRKGGVDTGGRS